MYNVKVYTDWLKQRATVEVAVLHVVTTDMVVVHLGSACGSGISPFKLLGTMLVVGPGLGMTASEFTALMGLHLGVGVCIGFHTESDSEVEVAVLPVGVGFGSSRQ